MFKAIISAGTLKDTLEVISQIVGEGKFRVTEDGIRLDAVDRSMVAFIDLHISKEAFDSFEADKEQSMGINIENFLGLIKRVKSDDKIALKLSEGKLMVTIDGDYIRNFSLPLIEIPQGETIDISKLKPPAKVQLKASFLEDGISDAGSISDHVVLEATPDSFHLRAEGNGSRIEVRADRGKAAITISSPETVKSSFSLEYLKKMLKASKISDVVNVELGKDYPLKTEFNQPDKVKVAFVLAPRVEE